MELSKYFIKNPNSSFDIVKHLVNTLPSNQLMEICDDTTNEDLWLYTDKLINPKPEKDTVKHVNAPLQQMFDDFFIFIPVDRGRAACPRGGLSQP